MRMMSDCLFCKIQSGEMKAGIVFESDDVVAFEDINPQAPTHVLVIPRKHIPSIDEIEAEDAEVVGKLFLAAKEIARERGLHEKGYRVVMNMGPDAGQVVYHIHLHLVGGRRLSWPPG